MRLKGKTILITGGASGIGLATVERCLQEDAHVVLADLAGSRGAQLGRLDGVFNNAGIGGLCPADAYTDEAFLRVLDAGKS